MLFKAGKRQVLSLVTGIIVLAGTFSLAGCITIGPASGTQDSTGSTSTSAQPSQGMKVASLKGATLVDTGVFSKVAVNTVLDKDSSLVSYSTGGTAIKGTSDASYGILGTSTSGVAINGSSTSGTGVNGWSVSGVGVYGNSKNNDGVNGVSVKGSGVYGCSTESHGLFGSSDSGTGVYGKSDSGNGVSGYTKTGLAGFFQGNVKITGTLTKGSGTFKIDHPQDPANKYLSHSFVESPDMKNVYDGTTLLDEKGEATVALPSYFESLNSDFRYQLTCIGGYAPVYIAAEIKDNQFKIAGGKYGLKVSWQVTGVRQDAFAKAHPVIVEQEKAANEKGFYLHPVELGLPAEKGIK